MTSQQQLVCDNSTVANFVQWASAVSNFFRTSGWINSADTGQLNGAGANNWAGVTTIPGSGAYYYEIFEPNDGLTNFYVKMEYGNSAAANCPALRISIGTTTDGAGNFTGTVIGPYITAFTVFTPPSNVSRYECDFSGAAGRIGAMLWRNAPNNAQQLFAIERSVSSSGAYTGSHVTLWVVGYCAQGAYVSGNQQTLVFGVGAAPAMVSSGYGNQIATGINSVRLGRAQYGSSQAFNGAIPFDTCAPGIGYWDYPLTMVGFGQQGDFVDGVTFQMTLYGSARTYMPSKTGPFENASFMGGQSNVGSVIALRYD